MSYPFPSSRRAMDVPPLCEYYLKTPHKPQTNQNAEMLKTKEANKENELEASCNHTGGGGGSSFLATATKSRPIFNTLRIPKRTAELPVLSDEEEDDDNFNCAAILNESFILSPARSVQCDDEASASTETPAADDSSQSFLTRFNKMGLASCGNSKATTTTTPAVSSEDALSQRLASKRQQLQRIQEYNEAGGISGAVQRFASAPTPLTQSSTSGRQHELETPLKATTTTAGDAQFVTPHVRSFSLRRPTRDLSATTAATQQQTQRIVNEFRSQKVLFQTPMTVTRAPPARPPDDSLVSLSPGGDAIAATSAHTPPLPKQCTSAKTKKSLENAFLAAEPESGAVGSDEQPLTPEVCRGNSGCHSNAAAKESIVHINTVAYALKRKLGCGGSSSVYLAVRQDNGQECALKVVDLHGDDAVVEGYLNETKMLAKLQGNSCVVALYDYQLLRQQSKLFLIMEKGNSDLHKILQGYTTELPLYTLANYLYQMLQAVSYIHQHGVIHSDLKPANFLMVNGRLKLIDFGIASSIAIDSTSIIKFSQAGTFNYISPEALIDTSSGSSPLRPRIKISTKADVWSLGCILYLLLYKRTPFSHLKNIQAKIHAISSPKPPIEYAPLPAFYPAMLLHMTRNCLQHEPKKRPSCLELLRYPFDMIIPVKSLQVPTTPAV